MKSCSSRQKKQYMVLMCPIAVRLFILVAGTNRPQLGHRNSRTWGGFRDFRLGFIGSPSAQRNGPRETRGMIPGHPVQIVSQCPNCGRFVPATKMKSRTVIGHIKTMYCFFCLEEQDFVQVD